MKRQFFSILVIFSKGHQLIDPADDIDLTDVPQSVRV
jgi:hypothetical protein